MIYQTFSYHSELKEFCKFPSELLDEVIGLSIPSTAKIFYTRLYDKAKFDPNMCIKISIQQLADMFHRGIRTIQLYLKQLEQKGFIKRFANFGDDGYQKANTIQILVPEDIIKKILKSSETTIDSKEFDGDEKNFTPYNNNDVVLKEEYINNNTEVRKQKSLHKKSDVILNSNFKLNKWQLAYIQGMLKNVLKGIRLTKELFDQVCFSISSEFQFKGACFKRKVNAIAKLLKNGAWRTPIGFYNHCEAGQDRREFYRTIENWKRQGTQKLREEQESFGKLIGLIQDGRKTVEEQEKSGSVDNFEILIKNAENRIAKAKIEKDYTLVQYLTEYIKDLYLKLQGAKYA